MSLKEADEFRNAIRKVGYLAIQLDNPYDRVRVSEWVRKLTSFDDSDLENLKIKNDYIQLLRIQVEHLLLQPPFTMPPPDGDLKALPELLGTLICRKIPGLPKTGVISPEIIRKSPDGRAYISIKRSPGNGVLCYMAVTPEPFTK